MRNIFGFSVITLIYNGLTVNKSHTFHLFLNPYASITEDKLMKANLISKVFDVIVNGNYPTKSYIKTSLNITFNYISNNIAVYIKLFG